MSALVGKVVASAKVLVQIVVEAIVVAAGAFDGFVGSHFVVFVDSAVPTSIFLVCQLVVCCWFGYLESFGSYFVEFVEVSVVCLVL